MSGCEMPKRKCTGANCPMQVGCVDPETCPEPEKCRYAMFPQTNGDRIRNMTDEALAEELADYLCNKIQDIGLCEKYEECGQGCFMDYLRSPVEESHE